MLYVFLVNTGTMMTFDMKLALESVENLRLAIYKEHNIMPANQVLLISGGDSLHSSVRVCKYTSAGTDTSPIFLFSKANCELPNAPESSSGEDMTDRVEDCLAMDTNFNTVASRTEMAHQLFDSDKSIIHCCEKLLNDQHLQHQGWASVVCNLDDTTDNFTKKANRVVQLYKDVIKNHVHYHSLLDNFETDKQNLKRIPLLKGLNVDNFTDSEEISLLDWIQHADSKNPIEELYCRSELNTFHEENLSLLHEDISVITRLCNNPDMKEIKGLDVRLAALDKLMSDAKKLFDKQSVLNKTFNQNQTRVSCLNDPSVLPELCRTHKEYLQAMLKTHKDLLDYRNRFHLAKRELSENLHKRLQWIIHIEERLKNGDETLMKVGIRLNKIREKLDIIQSLHLSPQIYLSSVSEVFRRKQFSAKFFRWAQETSEYARKIVESEICQRRLFASVQEKHFTKLFFPGMNDMPFNFAEPPLEFDTELPNISERDLEYLVENLPDMKRYLKVASTFEVPHFETDKTVTSTVNGESQVIHKPPMFDQETITSMLGDRIDKLVRESEETRQTLSQKENLIEDLNEKIVQLERELHSKSKFVNEVCASRGRMLDCLTALKSDLNTDLKGRFDEMSEYFLRSIEDIQELVRDTKAQCEVTHSSFDSDLEVKNREIDEQLRVITEQESRFKDLQEELEDVKKKCVDNNQLILAQECEIEQLKSAAEESKTTVRDKLATLSALRDQIVAFKHENRDIKNEIGDKFSTFIPDFHDEILKKCQEFCDSIKQPTNGDDFEARLLEEKRKEIELIKLNHKNELESLKHRFKLAISTTSIQRTESENSLEKVQLDIVDQSAMESEIQKLSNALQEKKLEYEQNLHKMKVEYENRFKNLKVGQEQDRMSASIMFEGQEQIIQKLKLKTYENLMAHLSTQLSTFEGDISPADLQEKFTSLKQSAADCMKNLENINSQSFISIPTTPDTSSQQPLEWFTSQFRQLSDVETFTNDDKISLNSCEIGNNVFIYFHKDYQQFAVFQKNSFLYFVHGESLKECDLTGNQDDSQWFIGKVLEKEFCMTKKPENRYKLPLDTKFYRVRVKQLTKFIPNSMFECIERMCHMTQSMPTTPTTSTLGVSTTSSLTSKIARSESTNSDQFGSMASSTETSQHQLKR